MARSGVDTRRRILDAAEQLFAERGIEAVALSEINVAAGQRNNAAVHYHFGAKSELVDAVLARHQDAIDAERDAEIERLEATGQATLRDVAAALIRPLAARLDDPSGVRWLQLQAHLLGDAERSPTKRQPWQRSAARVARLVAASPDADTAQWSAQRNAIINTLVFHGLADYTRWRGHDDQRSRDGFVATLIDATVAVVRLPEPAGAQR